MTRDGKFPVEEYLITRAFHQDAMVWLGSPAPHHRRRQPEITAPAAGLATLRITKDGQMPDSDASPTSQTAHRGGFWTFWTTLPGILTGVAALLTAIVGLITVLNRPGRDRSVTANDKATPTASSSAPEPGATPSSSPVGVLAKGHLAMRSPDDADLEKGLVGSGVSGGDLYLYCSGIDCLLNPMSSLMTVTEGRGDKASCTAALRSRRDGAVHLQQLRAGQILCVQTADGHIGALENLGLPGVGSTEFTFDYTLFR
jgi:hypothetical protein